MTTTRPNLDDIGVFRFFDVRARRPMLIILVIDSFIRPSVLKLAGGGVHRSGMTMMCRRPPRSMRISRVPWSMHIDRFDASDGFGGWLTIGIWLGVGVLRSRRLGILRLWWLLVVTMATKIKVEVSRRAQREVPSCFRPR